MATREHEQQCPVISGDGSRGALCGKKGAVLFVRANNRVKDPTLWTR